MAKKPLNNRLSVKELRWLNKIERYVRKEGDLFCVSGRDENGTLVCRLHHKGNGFVIKVLRFGEEEA